MPHSNALLAFALSSLLLVVIPGPSVLFVVGRSLALGRMGGLMSVIGNELGGLVLVTAVALGVGSIVAQSIVVFTAVKLAGAAYLIHLGLQAIRHRHDATVLVDGPSSTWPSSWSMLRQGFVVGATNPKTIVFFIAVLPQFTDVRNGSVPLQMMVLGLVFTLVALVCDSSWAVAAGSARAWFARSPRRLSRVRAAGGGMMIALGVGVGLAGTEA